MITLPVNLNGLNKIDPVIVNNVQQQTAEGVVHTAQKTKVAKDGEKEKEDQNKKKKLKEKVDEFNSLLKSMDINVNLVIEGEELVVIDMNGGVIRRYDKDALSDLFSKMENMMGIFIDIKT